MPIRFLVTSLAVAYLIPSKVAGNKRLAYSDLEKRLHTHSLR